MKRIPLFILLTLIISCSGGGSVISKKERSLEEQLIGRWQWLSSTGGISGGVESAEHNPDLKVIEFTGNQFKRYENGEISEVKFYAIIEGNSIYSEGQTKQISFANSDFTHTIVIEGDILWLKDECTDCYQSKFKRLD